MFPRLKKTWRVSRPCSEKLKFPGPKRDKRVQ
jgi:hypothetical protein